MKRPFLYVGSVVIFILAAVAFIFVPARSGGDGSRESVVFGKYDGRPIEYKPNSELALNINRYEQMAKRQGQSIEGFTWFYIYTYAFRDTIGEIARKTMVRDSGYEPSDKAVARATLALPYLLDEEGKYDARAYNRFFPTDGDKEDLRRGILESLVVQRFDEDLLGSDGLIGGQKLFGMKTSDAEAEFLRMMGEDRRSFDVVSFSKSSYPDSEVRKFAEENAALFEKLDVSAISFSDEATAKKVSAQLSGGALTFEDAVGQDYSQKYYTDAKGKISASYRYQLKGILADAASMDAIDSLAEGSLSAPIQTGDGWTVFRKDGKSVPADFGAADAVDFSAVTYLSEDLARSARERLVSGELSLTEALNGAGTPVITDGEGKLGAKTRGALEGILHDAGDAAALVSLANGAWSEPVRTQGQERGGDGWTLFRKDSSATTDAFDVAKRYVSSNEAGRIEDYFIARTRDLTSAATLSGIDGAVASFEGAERHSVSGIALNFGGTAIAPKIPSDVKPLADASGNEAFWEKAFSLKRGEFTEPMVLGGYVVSLRLSGEEKAAAEDGQLETLRGEIAGFDRNGVDSAIQDSKKVENNVWDAYSLLHM